MSLITMMMMYDPDVKSKGDYILSHTGRWSAAQIEAPNVICLLYIVPNLM